MPYSFIRYFATAALTAASSWLHAETQIENVSALEFQALIAKQDGIVLDVRTPDEVAEGKIPGASALNIYDEDFERKLNLMQKDKPIYVYCRSGGRSSQAAKKMGANGFKTVFNLDGGIGAWNRAKLPTEKPDASRTKKSPSLSPEAFAAQLNSKRIALVDFHTQWCAPCKQMEPIIKALQSDYQDRVNILQIDVDANPELAETYAIQGVPVFALFVNGQETWRHSGLISRQELQSLLAKNLAR